MISSPPPACRIFVFLPPPARGEEREITTLAPAAREFFHLSLTSQQSISLLPIPPPPSVSVRSFYSLFPTSYLLLLLLLHHRRPDIFSLSFPFFFHRSPGLAPSSSDVFPLVLRNPFPLPLFFPFSFYVLVLFILEKRRATPESFSGKCLVGAT